MAKRASSGRAADACHLSELWTHTESVRPRVPGRSVWQMLTLRSVEEKVVPATKRKRALASSSACAAGSAVDLRVPFVDRDHLHIHCIREKGDVRESTTCPQYLSTPRRRGLEEGQGGLQSVLDHPASSARTPAAALPRAVSEGRKSLQASRAPHSSACVSV